MFDLLTSWDNLLLAYRKAAKGKRGGAAVALFEWRLEDELLLLRAELRNGSYRPGAYHSFYIHEPKRRLISAAPFRDRVVHHALCNVIEPPFERSFTADSYANRVGKGTHKALDRCQRLARRHPFVLQCDIQRFFPAIDHGALRSALARKISDARVLHLIDLILASGADVHQDGEPPLPALAEAEAGRARGLPIGNLTSQFWANVYLNAMDHFVVRELRCPGYVRYVDDLLLFGDDKATLWRWRQGLEERLAALRLTLHPHAHPRPVTEGIPFLGFVVQPHLRRLKQRKGHHFARRFRRLLAEYRAGNLQLNQVNAAVQGRANHCRYGNTVGLRKAVMSRTLLGKTGERRL